MYADDSVLTYDEHKAAEAAFRGLPLDSDWSRGAQLVYIGILEVTRGRDILDDCRCEEATAVGS
ncbi:MAG: hypothetical protein R3B11_12820 [Nitrospira sp.]|mgnify:CR=1 FL=1|nr:hypothetical protein [Nitrospira sp.]HAP42032.1 hypothetical protein [Nitrospira sp.]